MNINCLAGFTLESCRFSKSSYSFEFSGQLESEFRTFLISTSYNFSVLKSIDTDSYEKFSSDVWCMLEKSLTAITVEGDEKMPKVTFNFEGNYLFVIWSDEPLIDNLLIVTEPETGDWFPIC